MKNFLKVLLVGLFVVGLSGMAGATEWKTVELPKGTSIKVDIPTDMVNLELEKGTDTDFSSVFVNDKDRIGIIVKKDSTFQDMKALQNLSGDYPFDQLTSDQQKEILADVSQGGESYRWITLSNGHKALIGEAANGAMQMRVMFVMKGKYSIGVAVIRDGKFSAEEIKITDEVFKRVQF